MAELEVKQIDFMGDTLMAARDNDGTIWAGVRWLCQGIGLTEGQTKRQMANIQSDRVLSRGGSNLILPTGSGKQDVFCIKLEFVPMWLAKISITAGMTANTPDVADKLEKYQLKAKDVLASAFLPNSTPNISSMIPPGGVASLINVLRRIMREQGTPPNEIAFMAKGICTAYNIPLPDNFVKVFPQQLSLYDHAQLTIGGQDNV